MVGHLAFILRNGLRRRGVSGLPEFPAEFEACFAATRQSAGAQAGYGDARTLLGFLDAYVEQLVNWVRGLSGGALLAPLDAPAPFATNAGEAMHFGGIHIALHAGQLSTIRRSLGKPPLV